MKVLFIDNAGAGFAGEVDVTTGTTISQFFKAKMKGKKPEDSLIKVNRQIVTAKQKLHAGDRITITPTKVEGAFC